MTTTDMENELNEAWKDYLTKWDAFAKHKGTNGTREPYEQSRSHYYDAVLPKYQKAKEDPI